jgi:tyrosyl-tRNA synthetase
MVPLRIVRKLQDAGVECDLIIGTLTGQLGDPSGQDKTRPILSWEEIEMNAARLGEQVFRVLDRTKTKEWWNHGFVKDMSVPAFLCDLVSKFTVANLMGRDAFRKRGMEGLRMHELLVPLLQGWDSVKVEAELEVGGNDQLFNFQVTRDLQVAHGQKPQSCILTPIINGTDGRKMSKSFGNCVWLDDTPTDMFGKTMSIPDEQVEQWVALLTDLHIPTIRGLHPMERKKTLAWEIVRQLHGNDAAEEARAEFERNVQRREMPTEMTEVTQGSILNIVTTLRACSKSQARKLIEQGGVKVDGVKVSDFDLVPEVGAKVQAGKRVWGEVVA